MLIRLATELIVCFSSTSTTLIFFRILKSTTFCKKNLRFRKTPPAARTWPRETSKARKKDGALELLQVF